MKRFFTDQDQLATIRRLRRLYGETGEVGHWSFWPFRRRLCIMDWIANEEHRLQRAGSRGTHLSVRSPEFMAQYNHRKWN